MKFLFVLSAILAWVSADISHIINNEASAPILKSNFEINPDGAYDYGYNTANGISFNERGVLKNANGEYPSISVEGAYSYTAPEGIPIDVKYYADENGFRAFGSHIPTGASTGDEALVRNVPYPVRAAVL